MKQFEKHGYTEISEPLRLEECPEEGMTEHCLTNDCEKCWNREVSE